MSGYVFAGCVVLVVMVALWAMSCYAQHNATLDHQYDKWIARCGHRHAEGCPVYEDCNASIFDCTCGRTE